jgi:SOS-response transcriptional repressor LexA
MLIQSWAKSARTTRASRNIPRRYLPLLFELGRVQNTSGAPPMNKDLARRLNLAETTVSTYLHDLETMDFITPGRTLTDDGRQVLTEHKVVVSASVPIVGEVKAGRTLSDDLRLNVEDIQDLTAENVPQLLVPALHNTGQTFALVVRGQSMVEERIYDGDYVLVELFDLKTEGPREGQLIVTRYIPWVDAKRLRSRGIPLTSSDALEFAEGPTLKYYYPEPEVERIRLSTRRNRKRGKNVLMAGSLVPAIGRVVGVYRPIE